METKIQGKVASTSPEAETMRAHVLLLPLCAALTTPPLAVVSRAPSYAGGRRHAIVRMDETCQDEVGIRADAEAAFRLLDLDGDGEISQSEMKSYLQQFKYTESAADKIYAALDMDSCGVVHLDDLQDGLAEYCRCSKCEPTFVEQVHADADAMFEQIDINGDGEISTDELRGHLLSLQYSEVAADAVFSNLDIDGNGSLDREELRSGFLKYSMFREAIVAVVKTLVQKKLWAPSQLAGAK